MTLKSKSPGLYVDAILAHRANPPLERSKGKARHIASHKFAVGQTVYFSPGIFEMAAPKGLYRVVRLLPAEGSGNQYRLKSEAEGNERVVLESQLSAG